MPMLLTPFETLWNFGLGYDARFTVWTCVGLLPFALWLLGRARLKAGPMWRTSMLVWLTLPPLVVLVSSFVLGPAYVERYLSGCVPAYLLLVVAGLISLPRQQSTFPEAELARGGGSHPRTDRE